MSSAIYDHEPPEPVEAAGIKGYLAVTLLLLLMPWTFFVLVQHFQWDVHFLAMHPRSLQGLAGIVFMPLIHADWDHLLANSFPLLILLMMLFLYYEGFAFRVLLGLVLLGGGLTWVFARPVYHVGASGLVYGLCAYLAFAGLFRRDRKSMGAALIVAMLYGSTIWGVFPIEQGVSWDGHLWGAIAGLIVALFYRRKDLPLPPPEEDASAEIVDDDYAASIPWQLPEGAEPEDVIHQEIH